MGNSFRGHLNESSFGGRLNGSSFGGRLSGCLFEGRLNDKVGFRRSEQCSSVLYNVISIYYYYSKLYMIDNEV